jgi:methionyl-tRNA synthetase
VPPGGEGLDEAIRLAGDRVGAALAGFDFRQATAAVWAIADEANRFINRARPWDLARADSGADGGAPLDAVLYLLARACSAAGRDLVPFLPDAAARITRQCTPRDGRLPAPSPVFRRLAR